MERGETGNDRFDISKYKEAIDLFASGQDIQHIREAGGPQSVAARQISAFFTDIIGNPERAEFYELAIAGIVYLSEKRGKRGKQALDPAMEREILHNSLLLQMHERYAAQGLSEEEIRRTMREDIATILTFGVRA